MAMIHRQFRSDLTVKYIRGQTEEQAYKNWKTHLKDKYDFISEEQWRAFVDMRSEENFKVYFVDISFIRDF